MLQSETIHRVSRWVLNGGLALALVAAAIWPEQPFWLAAALVLAVLASWAQLQRQLPFQNVCTAAALAALIGVAAHGFSLHTAMPLGPLAFSLGSGPQMFFGVPWFVPLLWILVIFNSRGVARLILRPWRKTKTYGYWLIAASASLALIFSLVLEPFAWHVKHLWLWQPTRLALEWQSISAMTFLGWGAVSLLILMFITPSLIRKQPGGGSAPDYQPLGLWLAMLLFFGLGFVGMREWLPLGLTLLIALVTTGLALRGARW